MKKIFSCVLCFCLMPNLVCASQAPEGFKDWVEKQMQEYKIPGVSIAVIEDYAIKWQDNFGSADLENKIPVTNQTRFQAASISKPVSALAALLTFANKDLSIDENINNYLTEYKVPENKFTQTKSVNLRNLLDHSAGVNVRFYRGVPIGEAPHTVLSLLTQGDPQQGVPAVKIIREPNTEESYAGGGYLIVQQLLLELYNQPFNEIMYDLVLKPLGMQHSSFTQGIVFDLPKQIAKPYTNYGDPLAYGPRYIVPSAVGGMYTTATDLAKFLISIQKAYNKKDNSVISYAIANTMLTPSINKNRSPGFEVNINKLADRVEVGDYFMHGGFNSGYLGLAMASKNGKHGIVILVNSSPADMSTLDVTQWGFLKAVVKQLAP